MQRTEKLIAGLRTAVMAVVSVAALAANAQVAATVQTSPGAKSSIQTVDELLRLENAAVLAKSRPPVSPSSAPMVAFKPPPPVVIVDSIYGTSGALKTDLMVNGMAHEGLRPGAKVDGCVVREIANSCVVLAPGSAKTAADMCPKSCWTGDRPMATEGASSSIGGMAGQPMPMPMPMPMSSLSSRQPAPFAPASR